MYCSKKCRKEAFNSYHRSECKLTVLYEYLAVERLTPLVVQMFLIGTEQGKQLTNLMKELKPSDIFTDRFDSDTPKFVRNYRSSLRMCRMTNRVGDIDEAIKPTVDIIIALLRTSFFREGDVLPVSFSILSNQTSSESE